MSTRPPYAISLLQLVFAVATQLAVVVFAFATLSQRVEAMETTVAPIGRGDFARLDERVDRMQQDIAWIRDELERRRDR